MSRGSSIRSTLAVALVLALSLAGCSPVEETGPETEAGSSEPVALVIGTLATQDALPLWVAEERGHFEGAGLTDVEIVTFQSAQECQAAFTAGSVDALMTDIIVAAKLHASGTPVLISTVMLGADTAEGRFAVVAAPGSGITTIEDLAGVPVGTAAGTITEYVLDKLMAEAGVAAGDVVKEEVPKMPVRFQLLLSGQLKAASLPEPFVTLAELQGATIVGGGDDTGAPENISQSVLVISREYTSDPGGAASLEALLAAWDLAVDDLNSTPDDFRSTLVSKAGLPEELADTYQVSSYPKAQPPAPEQVQAVLDWMAGRGYLTAEVTPADLLDR
ncbi:MAG: ABC transporter substrate-binding protein [Coriobacteriia bacterium]|nr:ABC transporter substrate-binding protein [Coriobacteriia bacterium]MBN2848559.1 ABC transporter substrate-binding protein [Coriobacteriia bacterium]